LAQAVEAQAPLPQLWLRRVRRCAGGCVPTCRARFDWDFHYVTPGLVTSLSVRRRDLVQAALPTRSSSRAGSTPRSPIGFTSALTATPREPAVSILESVHID
jgi:hypothetical protein